MKVRHPFLIFMIVVGCMVAALIHYLQTPHFARVAKQVASRYMPADLGIQADFSEFAIKLFPPGLSLRNPSITLGDKNILKLPAGSSVRAQRIDLNFQPFQMLSGDIRVHEVVIAGGDLHLILPSGVAGKTKVPPAKKVLSGFHWDELLQIRAEAVAIEDTNVRLVLNTGENLEFHAAALRLGQWTGKGGLGYEGLVDVSRLGGSFLRDVPALSRIESVRASAQVNAAGATLNELVVKAAESSLEATLNLKGNILTSRTLALEGTLRSRAELGPLLTVFAPKIKEPVGGVATFNGGIQGTLDIADLSRTLETLRAKGRFGLEDARYGRWEIDRADVQGAWESGPGGGELTVEKGVFQSAERNRIGGRQPAGGGKITLGSFKLKPGRIGKDALTVPIELERAHIHWLAAIALKDVYALDFRVTGPLALTYTPGVDRGPWNLISKVNLKVSGFQLDNQRLGQNKPLSKVLDIAQPIDLQGAIRIDSVGVHPDVTVALPKTKLALGGKIDFKTGYDLKAHGNVNFEDIGQIAETDIRGVGPLSVHVHGPTARVFVDFDTELEQASYLKMDLGKFKGRVTWDDDPQHLLLTGLQVQQGRTHYTAEGKLDLGSAETVSIAIRVPDGNMADLLKTFDYQTRDLWWFPRSLNGPVSGDVSVSGGLNMKKLAISARMSGTNWEYLGEKLNQVSLIGGYDQGRYYISDFKGTKHKGRLSGRISAETEDSPKGEQRLDWEFHTEQMSLNDFDWVAQLDVPIRGKISIDSVGSGKTGAIRSGSQILVTDMSVRGQSMPPSQVTVRSAEGSTLMTASLEGGAGTMEFSMDSKAGGTGYLRGVARRFDFAPALMLLNSRLTTDSALQGTVSGEVNLSFRSSEWERATGMVNLSEYRMNKNGASFSLLRPVSFRMNEGSFDLGSLVLTDGNGSEATFALRSRDGKLDGSLTGDVDLSIAEFLVSSVSQGSGTVGLDFDVSGAVREPEVSGRAELSEGSFQVPSIDSPFENVTGVFQLRQNVITVQKLEADLAGGHASAGGKITLFADRFPLIDLKGSVGGSKIKVYPFQYAKVRGSLSVSGDRLPYTISGNMAVESALSREKVMQKRQGESLKAAKYTPPPTLARSSDYPKFRLDLDVRADGNIVIQNDLFDAVAKGHLKVVNTLDTPRLLGNAEIIQGKMIFKDRVFQIQSASAEFDNPTVLNPRFTLTANTDVNGVKVQLYASGNTDRWKAELSSNPVMPESEIISLLALGMSSSDTRRLSASDRTLFEQGEAASLLLHSLDFNREVEEKTGVQIQLDESVNTLQGTSIFRPQSTAESAAAPKIVIRKRIADKVDLSYGNTVGVGAANQREVNAEVQVTPNFSIVGVWDDFETLDAKDKQTSFGLDVKLQTRFK